MPEDQKTKPAEPTLRNASRETRMRFPFAAAPHLRRPERSSALSLHVFIAVIPLGVFSFVNYGLRPVLLLLIAVGAAVLCDLFCCMLMRRRPSLADGASAVTGALAGAMLSPLSPYWLPVVAAVFAVMVVKMPFGGAGRKIYFVSDLNIHRSYYRIQAEEKPSTKMTTWELR